MQVVKNEFHIFGFMPVTDTETKNGGNFQADTETNQTKRKFKISSTFFDQNASLDLFCQTS